MSVTLRKRELPSGRTQLYLDIYRQGARRVEALFMLDGDRFQNRETLKMAETIRAKRELDLQSEMHGITGAYNRKSSFIKYLEQEREKRISKNTRRTWHQAIEHFGNLAGELVTFGDLNRELFEKFKTYLLNTAKLSPNSAQVYLARIKTALHQAVRDNLIPANPASDTVIKKRDRLPVFLTIEEIRKLDRTPCSNDQVRKAFIFGCFTGLRYSDVDRLTWDQVRDGYLLFTQQKTDGAERLPLSSQAQKILEEQKDVKKNPRLRRQLPENIVFYLPSQGGLDRHLKKWAEAAEIGKVISFHKSRHSFATLSLSAGIDIYTVSKLLGHKNIQTTQIYAKVIDEKKKQAIEMLPTLEKG
jgi:site-specific recombinase XerD